MKEKLCQITSLLLHFSLKTLNLIEKLSHFHEKLAFGVKIDNFLGGTKDHTGGAKMHTLAHVTARDQLQAHAVYTLNIKMTRFNFSTSVTS